MSIKKQEYYEGAALHILAKAGRLKSVEYKSPFFVFNGDVRALVKYATRVRSPWGFTFTPDELSRLEAAAAEVDNKRLLLGLVCGADGVVALPYSYFLSIAGAEKKAVRISCFRKYGTHYEVSGPVSVLSKRIAPSNWSRILNSD